MTEQPDLISDLATIEGRAKAEAARIRAEAISRGRGRTRRTGEQEKAARAHLDFLDQLLGNKRKKTTDTREAP